MFFLWFNGFLVICKNNFFLPTSSSFQDSFAEKNGNRRGSVYKNGDKNNVITIIVM